MTEFEIFINNKVMKFEWKSLAWLLKKCSEMHYTLEINIEFGKRELFFSSLSLIAKFVPK